MGSTETKDIINIEKNRNLGTWNRNKGNTKSPEQKQNNMGNSECKWCNKEFVSKERLGIHEAICKGKTIGTKDSSDIKKTTYTSLTHKEEPKKNPEVVPVKAVLKHPKITGPEEPSDDTKENNEDSKDAEIGDVDYSSWKIADLKKELKAKGLPVSGKKEELVERLMGHTSTDADL